MAWVQFKITVDAWVEQAHPTDILLTKIENRPEMQNSYSGPRDFVFMYKFICQMASDEEAVSSGRSYPGEVYRNIMGSDGGYDG